MACGGLFIALIAVAVWYDTAYSGFGSAAGSALFLAGSGALVMWGIVRAMEKKPPLWAYGAAVGGTFVLFTAIGPSVSTAGQVSNEKRKFEECSKSTNASDWKFKYESDVPEKFQRKEWRLEWMRARIREAKSARRVPDLRTVANECEGDEEHKDLLEPAKEEAIAALKTFYDAGKEKMFASKSGGTEFPIDNALREGFAVVIDELARSKDPNVYVLFKNSANLAEPAGQKKAYQEIQDDSQVRSAFPKGNAPEIPTGEAFAAKFDSRRQTTFLQAMTESFGRVFEADLLTLAPLSQSESRKKKIVIEVSSSIRRVPDYFVYTTGENKRVAGLLFNFEVDWEFELFSNTGRSLYKAPRTISQPSDARFDAEPGSPDWVPYSIMMDSAYFNYSREVTGRFGLVPPPKKDFFVFTK